MALSTKWRLFVTLNNSASFPNHISFGEMQLRTAAGEPRIIAAGDATFAASSADVGYEAAKGFDNNISTSWSTTGAVAPPHWVEVTYAAAIEIREYTLQPEDGSTISSPTFQMPKDFELQYFDGAAWIKVDGQTGQVFAAGETKTFTLFEPGEMRGDITLQQLTVNAGDRTNEGDVSIDFLTVSGESQRAGEATINLLFPTLIGTAENGNDATGLVSFSAIGSGGINTIDIERNTAFGVNGTVNHGAVTFDALTMDGGSLEESMPMEPLTLSGEMVSGSFGNGQLSLMELSPYPYLEVSGYIDDGIILPVFTLSATSETGAVQRDSDLTLQLMSVAGSGISGTVIVGGEIAIEPLAVLGSDEALNALPQLSLAGVMETGNIMDGSVTMALLTASGSSPFIHGDIELLSPLLSASGVTGSSIDGSVTLPLLSVFAVDAGSDIVLAPLTVSASGISGTAASGALFLLTPEVVATGLSENLLVGDIEITGASTSGYLAAGTQSIGYIEIASPSVSSQATGQNFGIAELQLPTMAVSGQAFSSGQGRGAIVLQPPSLSGTAYVSNAILTGSAELSLSLAATGEVGTVSTVTIELPLMEVDADGYFNTVGSATIELPLVDVTAGMESVAAPLTAAQQLAASATVKTVVLNTQTKAVTTYIGIAANSWAEFNGMMLAATPEGIIALTGDTDAGRQINAFALSAKTDFGTDSLKRLTQAYVGYRADGDMELTIVADDHHEYAYQLSPRQIDDQHATRVKFGKGNKGRYWQWRLKNRSGSDFSLDAMSIETETLSRKVA